MRKRLVIGLTVLTLTLTLGLGGAVGLLQLTSGGAVHTACSSSGSEYCPGGG